ncbi:hypothetical protein ACROYT_G019568 [Oculina patagonica]
MLIFSSSSKVHRHIEIAFKTFKCTKLVVIDGRMTATDERELYTDQEEVDTRMFLHAKHASSHEHQRVAIVSPDTDLMPSPLSLHALTGCDAMSSFAGKGKKRAFKKVRERQIMNDSVQVLGESLPLSEKSITRLQELEIQPRIEQEPVSHGLQLKEGRIEIVWTDLAPAPQAVMELVCCGFRGNCQTRLALLGKGLPCTEACTCSENCMNSATGFKDGDDDVNDDDEGEDK